MFDDNDAIDRAIDDAAREMTAGEPNRAMRVRVMERLQERRPCWTSPWTWSPIAAAAIVVVAVMAGRNPATGRDAERIAVLPSQPIPWLASVATMAPQAVSIERASVGPKTTRPLPSPASDVAALAPPPLEVSSLGLDAIEPGESIQVPRLETISPITLAPIGEPQGERR